MILPGAGRKEAVFSSSEDRIRASQASVTGAWLSIAPRSLSSWAVHAAESLFAVLFPADCRICAAPLVRVSRLPVCAACLNQILPVRGHLCSVCGERMLSLHALPASGGQALCPFCSRVGQHFAKAVAYGSYEGGLRELIHLLKYGGVRPAANVLGCMLAEAISPVLITKREAGFGSGPVVVIPVPLHSSRLRERGFNHAGLIARAALKELTAGGRAGRGQMVLSEHALERRRPTQSQTGLTIQQRRENMRGAFAVKRAQEVNGCEVLLVDDVYTTGATASECARVLRRAGATKVWVATVARTLKLASQYGASQYGASEYEMKPAVGVTANLVQTPPLKAVS
jgi:ComF family protein